MSTKEKQIKNSFIYMLPFLVSDFLPFITLPIFTRILTAEDYGRLALVTIYGLFASGLANFGMTAAFERNYFQYINSRLKMSQLITSTIIFTSSMFGLLALVTYFIQDWISTLLTGDSSNGSLIFWSFCAYYFYNIAFQYHLIYYKNAGDAKKHSFFKILNRSLSFIVSMLFVVQFRMGISGIILSQLISGIVVFLAMTAMLYRKYKFSFNLGILKESLRISYPLTPRIFMGVLSTQFDKYMINLMGTLGGTGVYHLGKKISDMLFTGMTAIQNVFNPHVYSLMFENKEDSGRKIGIYLTPFIYISVFAALMLVLFSEEIVHIFMASGYEDAAPIAMILTLYYAYLFFGKITSIQLIYRKKTHITSLLSFISIVLNIGFNIPLIYYWGAMGAALATLLSALISGSISILVAQKYFRIDWEMSKIVTLFAVLFSSACILLGLQHYQLSYLLRFPVKLVLLAVFVIYGNAINIVTKENILVFVKLFKRKQKVNVESRED